MTSPSKDDKAFDQDLSVFNINTASDDAENAISTTEGGPELVDEIPAAIVEVESSVSEETPPIATEGATSSLSSPSGHDTSRSSALKENRKAIENWNEEKKQGGSQRSFKSSLSNNESKSGTRFTERQSQAAAQSSDDSRQDQQAMMEMVAKLESTKKNLTNQLQDFEALKLQNKSSSKKVNQLMKDRAETTLRLSQLEKAKAGYYKRVRDAEAKADAFRQMHASDSKMIAELQARNEELGREVKVVRSKSEDGGSSSSASKNSRAPKSSHKIDNTIGNFNGSWAPERVQAFEKWELKIKRAPGLC